MNKHGFTILLAFIASGIFPSASNGTELSLVDWENGTAYIVTQLNCPAKLPGEISVRFVNKYESYQNITASFFNSTEANAVDVSEKIDGVFNNYKFPPDRSDILIKASKRVSAIIEFVCFSEKNVLKEYMKITLKSNISAIKNNTSPDIDELFRPIVGDKR